MLWCLDNRKENLMVFPNCLYEYNIDDQSMWLLSKQNILLNKNQRYIDLLITISMFR